MYGNKLEMGKINDPRDLGLMLQPVPKNTRTTIDILDSDGKVARTKTIKVPLKMRGLNSGDTYTVIMYRMPTHRKNAVIQALSQIAPISLEDAGDLVESIAYRGEFVLMEGVSVDFVRACERILNSLENCIRWEKTSGLLNIKKVFSWF